MDSFFANWSSLSERGGDDVIMEGDDSPETQLQELKKVVNDMRPLIESNPWLQSVITAL
jgi:DNA mismatch repair protein MSH2